MTIASSTTKPTHKVSAIRERLSRENPHTYITAKVPTREKGSARLGIAVAQKLRRKMKITMMTRNRARIRVNFTSLTELRIVTKRSKRIFMKTEGGRWAWRLGSFAFTSSTT